MLRFKQGVRAYGLAPEMLLALDRAAIVYQAFDKDCTVTSARGDRHSVKSRHYSGLAVDLRTRDLTEVQIRQIHEGLIQALGPDYDVILEADHFHIEYDPKNAYQYLTKGPQ